MTHLFLTSSIGTPGVGESIRAQLGHTRPLKTIFITTPVEPKDEQVDLSWYETDRAALSASGFVFTDYTLTGKNSSQVKQDLAGYEAIYVSGGNTNYLLEQSQKSGFLPLITDFVNSGKIYLSTSAGSIIAGPNLPPYLRKDDRGVFNLTDYSGYNLVNFTVLPHWGSPHFAAKYLGGRIKQIYDSKQPFILLNDHQYLAVQDQSFQIIDVSK